MLESILPILQGCDPRFSDSVAHSVRFKSMRYDTSAQLGTT
jgi:hypothetical protein